MGTAILAKEAIRWELPFLLKKLKELKELTELKDFKKLTGPIPVLLYGQLCLTLQVGLAAQSYLQS